MDLANNTDLLDYFNSPAIIIDKTGKVISRSKTIKNFLHINKADNFYASCSKAKNLKSMLANLSTQSVGSCAEMVTQCIFLNDLMTATATLINQTPLLFLIEFSPYISMQAKAHASLADSSNNLLSLIDPKHQYISVNRRYSDIWHLPKDEIEGSHISQILGEEAYYGIVKDKLDLCFNGQEIAYSDWFYSTEKQQMLFLKVSYQPVFDEKLQKVNSVAVTVTDITELGAKQENLTDKAYHDALCNLNNRHALREYFDHIHLSNNNDTLNNQQYCLIFLDLNKFKQINDQFGHEIGDDLLVAFAHNLKSIMRKQDFCCRWGGDEFVILMCEPQNTQAQLTEEKLAERFAPLNEKTYRIDNHQFTLDFSLGFAYFPQQGKSLNELIKIADTNMYKMKKNNH